MWQPLRRIISQMCSKAPWQFDAKTNPGHVKALPQFTAKTHAVGLYSSSKIARRVTFRRLPSSPDTIVFGPQTLKPNEIRGGPATKRNKYLHTPKRPAWWRGLYRESTSGGSPCCSVFFSRRCSWLILQALRTRSSSLARGAAVVDLSLRL